jgi:hypothetical protein
MAFNFDNCKNRDQNKNSPNILKLNFTVKNLICLREDEIRLFLNQNLFYFQRIKYNKRKTQSIESADRTTSSF